MAYVQRFSGFNKAYLIANVVLLGIIFLVVFPFACLSLVKNKSRKDVARRFIPWLKAAFWTFSLTVTLEFIHNLLVLCIITDVVDADSNRPSARTAYHTSFLMSFFSHVSAALVMVFLVELGPGIHHAIEGASRFFDRFLRYLAISVAAVVICLAFAFYGMFVDFQVNRTGGYGVNPLLEYVTDRYGVTELRDIDYIQAANRILLFTMSLVITSLSVYVYIMRKASPLRDASFLYLAAGLLNFLSATWGFAYAINWLLIRPSKVQDEYVMILDIILGRWATGIVLVISFFIAVKSREYGGVWSHTGKYARVDVENGRGH